MSSETYGYYIPARRETGTFFSSKVVRRGAGNSVSIEGRLVIEDGYVTQAGLEMGLKEITKEQFKQGSKSLDILFAK